jgi:tetratricopeptide (TPR) repeat protein
MQNEPFVSNIFITTKQDITMPNADYYNNKAKELFDNGLPQEAILLYNKAVRLGGGMHVHFHWLGGLLYLLLFKAYKEHNFNDEANKALEHAIFLDHSLTANIDIRQYLEALNLEEVLISHKSPYYTANSQHLVFSYNCQERIEGLLSLVYQDKNDELLQKLTSITKLASEQHLHYHIECSKIYFNRGLCFLAINERELAINDFNIALEFDKKNPNNSIYKSYIDRVE